MNTPVGFELRWKGIASERELVDYPNPDYVGRVVSDQRPRFYDAKVKELQYRIVSQGQGVDSTGAVVMGTMKSEWMPIPFVELTQEELDVLNGKSGDTQ